MGIHCHITFIHLLKFHRILTRLRQPVDIEIVKKKESKTWVLLDLFLIYKNGTHFHYVCVNVSLGIKKW
jgi:hypothetical protein